MLKALVDLNKYKSDRGLTDGDLAAIGDFNGDGLLTNADIQPELDLTASQGGAGAVTAVPEPASLVLVMLALPAILSTARRRRLAASNIVC
jgi:hypothetical protein